MLPRKFRLPSSITFRNARVFYDKPFSIKVQPNNLSYARFGFIVGKAVDKRAVVRNRIKRVTRSIIEEQWVSKLQAIDMLVVVRKDALGLEREILEEKITEIMKKITI